VVSDALLAEVRKLQGVSAIGTDEIKDMLSHEANKQMLGCETDESCLAEIGGALGVDDLVTGKLSRVGDNHVLLIRRIDQRRAQVVAVVNRRLKAESGQEFLLAVGPAIEELFSDRPLREGASRGVGREEALRLDPPPVPTWGFYTLAGATVAAVAAGTVFGLLARNEQNRFNDLLSQPQPEGLAVVARQNAANDRALMANISYGVAGGLAITSAVIGVFFTDWWGYGEAER